MKLSSLFMLPATMSNPASIMSEETSFSSGNRVQDLNPLNPILTAISPPQQQQQPQIIKKKRNLPGNPDPDAEVIALSPKTLLTTNRFVCEICNKGFQRDQNLQLHRRGHNLPWKLRQRSNKEMRKRVYVCPEPSCINHHPSKALGDLTGIKKHYRRKHGEKKWKCEKCSKRYAVQSDWKAHSKTCGMREYRCDCGTLFSRKDSYVTHRAFCDALAEESAKLSSQAQPTNPHLQQLSQNPHNPSPLFSSHPSPHFPNPTTPSPLSLQWDPHQNFKLNPPLMPSHFFYQEPAHMHHLATLSSSAPSFNLQMGGAHHPSPTPQMLTSEASNCMLAMGPVGPMDAVGHMITPEYLGFGAGNLATWQKNDGMTRNFMRVSGEAGRTADVSVGELLSLSGVDFTCDRDHTIKPGYGFSETWGGDY